MDGARRGVRFEVAGCVRFWCMVSSAYKFIVPSVLCGYGGYAGCRWPGARLV